MLLMGFWVFIVVIGVFAVSIVLVMTALNVTEIPLLLLRILMYVESRV